MNKYREVQSGGIIVGSIVLGLILFGLAYAFRWKELFPSDAGAIAVFISLWFVLLLFSRFIVVIDQGVITLSFGVGLIKKRIDLSEIKSAAVVRNKWIYGWGIRYWGGGWMWNFKGLDAVEIHYKDSSKKFRIGSSNPEALQKAIIEQIE